MFHPRRWFRFSLRTMFVWMTLTAVACYWLMMPTITAQRFAAAIQAGDYPAAAAMFAPGTEFFQDGWNDPHMKSTYVGIQPLTWHGLWNGERHVFAILTFHIGDTYAKMGFDFRAKRHRMEFLRGPNWYSY